VTDYPTGYPTDYPAAAAPAVPYANWGQRAGGYLIDALPIVILDFIGVHIDFIAFFLFGLIGLAYAIYNRWYLGGTTGQTIGRKALNIKLISEQTGQPIGPLMAFVRDICHILDSIACYIGWLFPIWDAKRQTFADKILGTVVVPA
jgi:uncharacterized RDD family membrane protein YckC